MTHATLASSRFSSRRTVSPGALGAALAVHAGVALVFFLLPPEMIPVETITRIWATNIPVPPEPTPEPPPPEPTVKPRATQANPVDSQIAASEPVFDNPQAATGVIVARFDPPPLPFDPVVPADPPPVHSGPPVIVGAAPDPRFAGAFQPAYPPAMLRLGQEGSCTVRVAIDPLGRVNQAVAVRGEQAFCDATQRQALAKWRFRPATRDGVPTATEREMTVQFHITE